MKNPSLVQGLLYDLNLDEVLKNAIVHDISTPTSATHHVSIRYNEKTGQYEGIPDEVRQAIEKAGYTVQDVFEKNPEKIKDLLYGLNLDDVVKDAVVHEISAPVSSTHHVSITVNKEGKYEGVPQAVLDALREAGITEKQALENPTAVSDLLYKLNLQDVLNEEPSPTAREGAVGSISPPTKVAHHVSIKLNKETGKFEGIPPVILDAMEKQGLTMDAVQKDPMLIKDMLYKLDFNLVAGAGKTLTLVPSHSVDKPSTLRDPTNKVTTSEKTGGRGQGEQADEFQQIRYLLPRAIHSAQIPASPTVPEVVDKEALPDAVKNILPRALKTPKDSPVQTPHTHTGDCCSAEPKKQTPDSSTLLYGSIAIGVIATAFYFYWSRK